MSKWPAVCGGRVTPQLINRILMYVGEFGYMTVWYSVNRLHYLNIRSKTAL